MQNRNAKIVQRERSVWAEAVEIVVMISKTAVLLIMAVADIYWIVLGSVLSALRGLTFKTSLCTYEVGTIISHYMEEETKAQRG